MQSNAAILPLGGIVTVIIYEQNHDGNAPLKQQNAVCCKLDDGEGGGFPLIYV